MIELLDQECLPCGKYVMTLRGVQQRGWQLRFVRTMPK
jgi:hypothetical protein